MVDDEIMNWRGPAAAAAAAAVAAAASSTVFVVVDGTQCFVMINYLIVERERERRRRRETSFYETRY